MKFDTTFCRPKPTTVFILALPAVTTGLGLAVFGVQAFSEFAAQQLNLNVASGAIEPQTLLIIVGISLFVPLIAAALY